MADKHIQPGFFDLDERYARLSEAGDPLEALNGVVDWELFRKPLRKALKKAGRSDRKKGGRPPFDPVLMFKVLVLQALYGLSDDAAEYVINDRLSFMRFLGLGLHEKAPDAKTIWLFREHLAQTGAVERLFERFDRYLRRKGYLAMGGQIVDASIIEAPKQRLTKDEKETLKDGRVPQEWEDEPAKLRQKDTDARWTLKRGRAKVDEDGKARQGLIIPAYGYKNHVSVDRRHKLIRKWLVTDAAAYDGARLAELLDAENTASDVWADTAYRSKRNEQMLKKRGPVSRIQHKKPKGRELPERLARANGRKSKVRALVEHVFAGLKNEMNLFVRTIGLARAKVKIGMANLAWNLRRFVWLESRAASG
jgi:IS5 family transposase